MAQSIRWPVRHHREQSPFEPGDGSSLRVTAFFPADDALNQESIEAIRCLHELAQRKEILELTGGGCARNLEVNATSHAIRRPQLPGNDDHGT